MFEALLCLHKINRWGGGELNFPEIGIRYFFFWKICHTSIHKINHWQHLNCGVFLHKKTSRKKILEGLGLFLLQDYLHFKGWIMVFTTFRIYERFLILFVHIFVSLDFTRSSLTDWCITYANPTLILLMHNFSLWAFFFFSIWLGSLVFLRVSRRTRWDKNTQKN